MTGHYKNNEAFLFFRFIGADGADGLSAAGTTTGVGNLMETMTLADRRTLLSNTCGVISVISVLLFIYSIRVILFKNGLCKLRRNTPAVCVLALYGVHNIQTRNVRTSGRRC